MTKKCRHEFVFLFQRKLVDIERRLVKTKAYLPTGFSPNDFDHLNPSSYCFCSQCRLRLFPKNKKLSTKNSAKNNINKGDKTQNTTKSLSEILIQEFSNNDKSESIDNQNDIVQDDNL